MYACKGVVEYGYNLVVDAGGAPLSSRGVPLQGGEQLIHIEEYQKDYNAREYAQIFAIVAPI